MANLEGQIGVGLFDRGGRVPTLTDEGRALLARARAVATEVDLFQARAKGLASGLETELSLVVDAMFPVTVLACASAAFQVQFPAIPLRLHVEMWEAVADPVLDGRCAIGLMGSLVEITVEDDPPEGHAVVMSAVHLTNSPLGPAGRWFVDRIKEEAASRIHGNASTSLDPLSVVPIANRTPAQPRAMGSSSDRPRLYPVSDCGAAIESRDLRKVDVKERGRRGAS